MMSQTGASLPAAGCGRIDPRLQSVRQLSAIISRTEA